MWGTFVAGPYIDAPDSGEQLFNQGAIAVVQGDQPILVNATGWLPQAGGNAGETFVYDDSWGQKTRLLNNTFYVAGAIQQEVAPALSQTHVDKYEEQGVCSRARVAHRGHVRRRGRRRVAVHARLRVRAAGDVRHLRLHDSGQRGRPVARLAHAHRANAVGDG